jgi:hypothetical protein
MSGRGWSCASKLTSVAALMAAASCGAGDRLTPLPAPGGHAPNDGGADLDAEAGGPAAWAEMSPPPSLATGATVTDMWAGGDDDLFVAGYIDCAHDSSPCAGRVPLVLHWRRDSGWSNEEGLPAVGWTPWSIHGTSAEDVWAVGGDAIYHRDATAWSLVDPSWQMVTTGRSEEPISLQSVRAFPGGEIWAVSTKFVLHGTGGLWRATLVPAPPDDNPPGSRQQYLNRLWAFAPDEIWVSGFWVSVDSTMNPTFLCRVESGSLDCIAPTNDSAMGGVAALFGAGDGRVWAAVPYYSDGHEVPVPLERIDWSGGKTVTAPSIDGWPAGRPLDLFSMWGRSADDVWGVGSGPRQDAGEVTQTAQIVHFDGQAWTTSAPPPAAAQWCTLVAGGRHTVFVATSGGRIFRLDQTTRP